MRARARIWGGGAILKRDLAGLDEERKSILARQVKIALYGQDDANTRAFEGLAAHMWVGA